jgi:hypothetical protein
MKVHREAAQMGVDARRATAGPADTLDSTSRSAKFEQFLPI